MACGAVIALAGDELGGLPEGLVAPHHVRLERAEHRERLGLAAHVSREAKARLKGGVGEAVVRVRSEKGVELARDVRASRREIERDELPTCAHRVLAALLGDGLEPRR